MNKLFFPISHGKPAAVIVNGHRLVILARDPEELKDSLQELGADSVQEIKVGLTKEDEQKVLSRLARKADAGVVITPGNVGLDAVLENLHAQLPWLH